jgi:hypothetical protein
MDGWMAGGMDFQVRLGRCMNIKMVTRIQGVESGPYSVTPLLESMHGRFVSLRPEHIQGVCTACTSNRTEFEYMLNICLGWVTV